MKNQSSDKCSPLCSHPHPLQHTHTHTLSPPPNKHTTHPRHPSHALYSLERQFNSMSSLAHLFLCHGSFRSILIEQAIQQYVITCPPIPMSWVIQIHTHWTGDSTICHHLPTYSYAMGHSDPYSLNRRFNSMSSLVHLFLCRESFSLFNGVSPLILSSTAQIPAKLSTLQIKCSGPKKKMWVWTANIISLPPHPHPPCKIDNVYIISWQTINTWTSLMNMHIAIYSLYFKSIYLYNILRFEYYTIKWKLII